MRMNGFFKKAIIINLASLTNVCLEKELQSVSFSKACIPTFLYLYSCCLKWPLKLHLTGRYQRLL